MLLLVNRRRTLLMCNGLRDRSAQRAWLGAYARFRWGLRIGALALALVTPSAGAAEEPALVPGRSWEAAGRRSFVILALEIAGFI
jgi:hypothetical protein